jgi:hypothetical protein
MYVMPSYQADPAVLQASTPLYTLPAPSPVVQSRGTTLDAAICEIQIYADSIRAPISIADVVKSVMYVQQNWEKLAKLTEKK